MEKRGCAQTEQADKFAFNSTWTHQEVDHYLRHVVFPIPFKYVERMSKGKLKEGIPNQ